MTATATTPIVTGIDISGYLVKDAQKQIAFYRDMLGIVPTEVDAEGRGAEFTLPDGSTFGVWRPDDGETGGFVMLAVGDLQVAIDTYRSRGLEVTDAIDTPVCSMAFLKDPEDNGLILHQRK